MQIILLEKLANLGNLGDIVKVRQGYARNYLIPNGKAKRATPENIAEFEQRRADLEKAQNEASRPGRFGKPPGWGETASKPGGCTVESERNMWLRVAVVIVVVLGACMAVAAFVGSRRWEAEIRALRSRLEAGRAPGRPRAFDARDLDGLPAPVQRYFRIALTEGQPMVAAASLEHAGTFSTSETAVRWKPSTSKQRVVTRPPGFDWDARIAMVPGVAVYVHDAYVAGEGILHAALFGLINY